MDLPTALEARLQALLPEATRLLQVAGTPGAAIAVIHDGKLLHSDYIGVRDKELKLPVTDATIFPCASLTKAIVSAAVALCVEDGKFCWGTPVKDILPDFCTKSEVLYHQMTPVDCLSHRAGMQGSLYWLGSMNNILISHENSMNLINDLKQVNPFREGYIYNNLGYEIAGHLIEQAAGQSWGQVVQSRIFQPLGMSRSGTRYSYSQGDENVAKGYEALDDGTVVEVVPMLTGDDTVGGAGSAMRSCIKDLVKLYTAFLESGAHQFEHHTTSTPGSPLKQVPFLFSSKIARNPISYHEDSYALGWARLQTPGPMGAIGLNPDLLDPKPAPDVARGHPSELILYHQGMMPGNMAAVNLIPSTKGAIIVLTNSLALNDAADWLGQLYLEAYLGVKDRNDYIALSEEAVKGTLRWYPDILAELQQNQIPGTTPRDLSEYTGRFNNEAGTMMIEVSLDDGGNKPSLQLAFQGLQSEIYPLRHYHHDVFTWLMPRNELVRRGRLLSRSLHKAQFFKIEFSPTSMFLTWWHDPRLTEPEKFTRHCLET